MELEHFGFQQSGIYFYFPANIFYCRIHFNAEYPSEKSGNSSGQCLLLQHRGTGNAGNVVLYSSFLTDDYCQLSSGQNDSGNPKIFPPFPDTWHCL